MKIAFVISTLSAGGAERVAAILCNRWAQNGHAVSLVTFESVGAVPHYAVHPAVARVPLDLLRTTNGAAAFVFRSAQRVRRLRSVIKRLAPDVIVSFIIEQNVTTILSSCGLGMPVIISERVHPGFHAIGRVRSLARKLVYPRADAVVVQTAEIARWFEQHMNLKCEIIANPINLDLYAHPHRPCQSAAMTRRLAVAMGRLETQKGFDILIAAFARIASTHRDWDLAIFGDGSERANLARLIELHHLNDRVVLPGTTDKVPEALIDADLFVHSSLYEGYPNAVAEALAAGCCVIATDAPGGTAELLGNGKYGTLVPPNDVGALAAGLDQLMSNAAMRKHFSRKAPGAVRAISDDFIADKWIDLFSRLISKGNAPGHS